MTGILKVDTIQKNDGSTPTAADLGLNVSGAVLQVISTIKTDVASTTSSSFVDVTGLSLSITPKSASSKIFLMCNMGHFANSNSDGNKRAHMRFTRDGSAICVGDSGTGDEVTLTVCARSSAGEWHQFPASATYLDSPNTTSEVTYKVQITRGNDAAGEARINLPGGIDANIGRAATTFTLMEIAG